MTVRHPPPPTFERPFPLAVAPKVAPASIVLAHPAGVAPARHARSTLILGSIASVREAGHLDAYTAWLAPEHRELLMSAVAGTWLPIEVAFSHYDACDRLGLPAEKQLQNGRSTLDQTRATLAGTVTRMATASGLTPWNMFPHYQRFWSRGFDGGSVSVARLGPKEARLEVVACGLAESTYFRNALRGIVVAATELFCRRAYAAEAPGERPPASAVYRVQWA